MSAADPSPPPVAALRARVRAILRDVLDVPAIDLDDDFFALGGTSLQALRVSGRLERALSRPVTAAMLFANPTPRRLAAALAAPPEPAPPPAMADTDLLLAVTGASPAQLAALVATLPASPPPGQNG